MPSISVTVAEPNLATNRTVSEQRTLSRGCPAHLAVRTVFLPHWSSAMKALQCHSTTSEVVATSSDHSTYPWAVRGAALLLRAALASRRSTFQTLRRGNQHSEYPNSHCYSIELAPCQSLSQVYLANQKPAPYCRDRSADHRP